MTTFDIFCRVKDHRQQEVRTYEWWLRVQQDPAATEDDVAEAWDAYREAEIARRQLPEKLYADPALDNHDVAQALDFASRSR